MNVGGERSGCEVEGGELTVGEHVDEGEAQIVGRLTRYQVVEELQRAHPVTLSPSHGLTSCNNGKFAPFPQTFRVGVSKVL